MRFLALFSTEIVLRSSISGKSLPGKSLNNDTSLQYLLIVQARHRKTLKTIFETPTRSNIPWKDIEALLIALGGQKEDGQGSWVRFILNGVFATFHRPHPKKENDKGAVVSVRRFLENAGVKA